MVFTTLLAIALGQHYQYAPVVQHLPVEHHIEEYHHVSDYFMKKSPIVKKLKILTTNIIKKIKLNMWPKAPKETIPANQPSATGMAVRRDNVISITLRHVY